MDKNKGTIHWSKIWEEKIKWTCDILNEVDPTMDWAPHKLCNASVPATIITAILELANVQFQVDWKGHSSQIKQ